MQKNTPVEIMNSLWLFWFSSYCTVHYNSKQNRRSYVTRHRQDQPAEMKKHSCDKNCSTSKHWRQSSDNSLLKFTTWKMAIMSKSVLSNKKKEALDAVIPGPPRRWLTALSHVFWLRSARSEIRAAKTEEDGGRVTRRGLGCVCVCVFLVLI